jgi:hypothetical protein
MSVDNGEKRITLRSSRRLHSQPDINDGNESVDEIKLPPILPSDYDYSSGDFSMGLEGTTTDYDPSDNEQQKQTVKKDIRRCRVEGCVNKGYLHGQLCNRHGNPAYFCKVEDCSKTRKKKGLCTRHFKKMYPDEFIGARKETHICLNEGCGNIARPNGLCKWHSLKTYICRIDGCERTAQKNRLCLTHFDQIKDCPNQVSNNDSTHNDTPIATLVDKTNLQSFLNIPPAPVVKVAHQDVNLTDKQKQASVYQPIDTDSARRWLLEDDDLPFGGSVSAFRF